MMCFPVSCIRSSGSGAFRNASLSDYEGLSKKIPGKMESVLDILETCAILTIWKVNFPSERGCV